MRVVVVAAYIATVEAHSGLYIPTARNANDRDLPGFENGAAPTPGATQCTCGDGLSKHAPLPPLDAEETDTGVCWGDLGMNYNSHPHQMKVIKAADASACCVTCSETVGCKFFTYLKRSQSCYLKNATTGRSHLAGAVSGGTGTKPPLPAPGGGHGNNNGQPCDMGLRAAAGQNCLWWNQGCSIGCAECATDIIGPHGSAGGAGAHPDKIGFSKRFCNASYNSGGPAPMMNSTLPREAWTMNVHAIEGVEEDAYRFNPWRAPGYAPVVDACGMAGGKGPQQGIGGDSSYTTTPLATMGDLGSKVLKPSVNKTNWKAGTSVEVAWGIRYNHGGGYQYRLCPAKSPLTEECMQAMPLEFDRDIGTSLVWNNGSRYQFKNVFVDQGTWPKGSTWARNPIPRVADDNKGLHDPASCPGPSGTSGPGCIQFPAPCPQDVGREPWSTDGSGQGACSGDWTAGLIADRVKIPKALPAGDYVLGWRWDCEETAQIWLNCADVTVEA